MIDCNHLAVGLANAALREAGDPAAAVTALMTGAAAILNRDLGPEQAAQAMLEITIDAHTKLVAAGIIAEPTSH